MSSFPNSPQLLKAGLVLIDPTTGAIQRIITLQYNPDTLTRSLQPQASEPGNKDRSEALRLKGPAIETFKVEAEIDATDQLENPAQNPTATQYGIFPLLAALETIVYPTSDQLLTSNTLAQGGTLEIAPLEAPLSLFVWSKSRVVPVRITELSITEEAFDVNLNPIRAKVSLGMRVLSVDDLGYDEKGGHLFLVYQQEKERLSALNQGGSLSGLGLGGIS
jgi:hypothetical protein